MAKSRALQREEAIAQAITALGIDSPIYRTVTRQDGTVEITTRDGTFTWTPRPVGRAHPAPAPERAET